MLADITEKFLVGYDNQSVNRFLELLNSFFCLPHSTFTLKRKGFGNHAYCQGSRFLGDTRNDGCGTGTCSTTHTSGDESHIRTFQHFANGRLALFGGISSNFRIGTCTEATGQFSANLNFPRAFGLFNRLQIGIGDNKLHATKIIPDHGIDGIIAPPSYTNDLDSC